MNHPPLFRPIISFVYHDIKTAWRPKKTAHALKDLLPACLHFFLIVKAKTCHIPDAVDYKSKTRIYVKMWTSWFNLNLSNKAYYCNNTCYIYTTSYLSITCVFVSHFCLSWSIFLEINYVCIKRESLRQTMSSIMKTLSGLIVFYDWPTHMYCLGKIARFFVCVSASGWVCDGAFVHYLFLTLEVLNFWKFTSYCSLKPLWSGMGEVVPARTSPTLHPPYPPTVHQLSRLAL